ncbi:hypothetical protein BDF22DRAFT_779135 [Syncephalis plumigaleata]|nr:hypothetical protein BDF22DRAFT_779135 [Syncephalis plumigaleata]
MPKINYTNPNDTEWVNSASRLWGIPLHPLGEMDILDYYVASDSLEQQSKKIIGDRIQVVNGGKTASPNLMVLLYPKLIGIADCVIFISMELGLNRVGFNLIMVIQHKAGLVLETRVDQQHEVNATHRGLMLTAAVLEFHRLNNPIWNVINIDVGIALQDSNK